MIQHSVNRIVIHLEYMGNKFDEKVREIHEKLSKSGKNEIVLANVLEMLTSAFHFHILPKDKSFFNVTFCYRSTADLLQSLKNI